jgi:hypothetical protein
MAYGEAGFSLTLELTDNGAGLFLVKLELDPTKNTFALAEPVASDTVLKLSAISYLAIKRYWLSRNRIDGLVPTPTNPLARREKAAAITLRHATDPVKRLQHDIPGPLADIFESVAGVADYNRVDTDDNNVEAYFDNFKVAGAFRVSDNEAVADVAPVVSGKRITKGGFVRDE